MQPDPLASQGKEILRNIVLQNDIIVVPCQALMSAFRAADPWALRLIRPQISPVLSGRGITQLCAGPLPQCVKDVLIAFLDSCTPADVEAACQNMLDLTPGTFLWGRSIPAWVDCTGGRSAEPFDLPWVRYQGTGCTARCDPDGPCAGHHVSNDPALQWDSATTSANDTEEWKSKLGGSIWRHVGELPPWGEDPYEAWPGPGLCWSMV